jgi:phosphopentomutase
MQAEPDWNEMYEWARNMAWQMKPNNYWVSEQANAAVSHLYKEWQKYRDLVDEDFKKVVSTIMYREMLANLADDNSRGTRVTARKADPDVLTCQPKHHSTEDEVLQNCSIDDVAERTETQIDLQMVQTVARHLFTRTEMRVMRIVFRDPEASAAKIAAELGEMSEGAVRIKKHNAITKLKSFFNKDINGSAARTLR